MKAGDAMRLASIRPSRMMILAGVTVGLTLAGWGWWASPSAESAAPGLTGPAGRWVEIDVPCDCPTDN